MRRLPALTGREVIRALEKAGFVISRTSGSHYRLVHAGSREQGTGHLLDALAASLKE